MLRQDPDVIMVGEMRDAETARIAVQAALTGHLVLSTLHTNDAGGSIARLLDMGVEDYLLCSTVRGILAQRLVRSLCVHCKQSAPASPEILKGSKLERLTTTRPILLMSAVGCAECNGTGFRGRIAVMEFLLLNEALRKLVMEHADATLIQLAAIRGGMRPMYEDGLLKVLAGTTTLGEVLRVTQDTEEADAQLPL
jgi:general secretion pathway protein E